MASKFRNITKRILIFVTIGVVIFYLLACLAPSLNPGGWWMISLLGLGFPIILLILLLTIAGWLILAKPRIALIPGIALLLGYKSILVFFAFHMPGEFHYKKDPGTLRVVSWNVARFVEMKRNNNKGSQTRLLMLDMIKQQDADVVCLQEFFHSLDPRYYDNLFYIRDSLGYPYTFFSHDVDGDNHFTGSVIFSRYPILDSGLIRYPRPTLPEALLHVDVKFNNDTIRVYTTHLQSLQFKPVDYMRISEIKGMEDSLLTNSKSIFGKLRKGFTNRSIQADLISTVKDDCPYPIVFCADLNDVPTSYTYFRVKGNMQDAFLKKGFGVGRTFTGISPTLRIDYIFASNDFSVKQFTRVVKNYSDHYMILADVALKNPRGAKP